MNTITDFKELNSLLISHYNAFNTERFYLDSFEADEGFLSIVTSSMQDSCPYNLCRNIAKFCKKHINASKFRFIYVACYSFPTDKL